MRVKEGGEEGERRVEGEVVMVAVVVCAWLGWLLALLFG